MRRGVIPHPSRDQFASRMSWMQRLRYVFDIDLYQGLHCGAALRVLAVIPDRRVSRRHPQAHRNAGGSCPAHCVILTTFCATS